MNWVILVSKSWFIIKILGVKCGLANVECITLKVKLLRLPQSPPRRGDSEGVEELMSFVVSFNYIIRIWPNWCIPNSNLEITLSIFSLCKR